MARSTAGVPTRQVERAERARSKKGSALTVLLLTEESCRDESSRRRAFPNESASRVWRMHDCLRSSRARFNSSAGYFLMCDHGCFVIGCRDRVERRIRDCPWSVVDARDSAKVVDQVRLLARTLTDVDVTRCGGGLQSRFQWVRLPPASLWIESIDGVVPAAGGAPAGVCSDCSEHGF